MSKITKAIVALLGAVATWGVTAAEDGVYTQVELWGAVLAVATAAAVWVAPNERVDESGMSEISLVILTVVATLLILFIFDLDIRQ